jgi:hypothetical protein
MSTAVKWVLLQLQRISVFFKDVLVGNLTNQSALKNGLIPAFFYIFCVPLRAFPFSNLARATIFTGTCGKLVHLT